MITRVESHEITCMTLHANADRINRIRFAESLILNENGTEYDTFEVIDDRNGYQIHTLYSNGVVKVSNRNGKLVTVLIARPGQIIRYYKAIGEYAPEEILSVARRHANKGYNKH